MNKKEKRYFKIIKRSITQAGQTVSFKEATLEHTEKVIGVFVNFDDNKLKKGATISLDIDNQQILPSEFEASLIASKDGLGINDVPLAIDEKASGTSVEGKYIDKTPAGEFTPYEFRLYLICLDYK